MKDVKRKSTTVKKSLQPKKRLATRQAPNTTTRQGNQTQNMASTAWQAAIDSLSDAIFLLDQESTVIQCNKASENFLGKPYSQIIGKKCWELVHQTSTPIEGCPVVRLKQTRQRETMPLPLNNRHFEVVVDPILNKENELIGAVHTVTDVTERKHMEQALRESEEKYRALVENTQQGIAIAQDGKVKFANPGYIRITGYSIEEMLSLDPTNIIHPDDYPMVMDYLRRRLSDENVPTTYQLRIIDKSGNIKWLERAATDITWGGRPAIIVLDSDITGRKQTEDELRESEERYRMVADNMDDTVWLMDMNLRTTWATPSVTRRRGYTIEELRDMPLEKNMTPESLSVALDVLTQELTPERLAQKDLVISRTLELEFYRKDGSTFWSEISMRLLRDKDGNPTGFLGSGRDITERKQAEEALQEHLVLLGTLIDNLQQGVLVEDASRKILHANNMFCELFGIPSLQLVIGADCMATAGSAKALFAEPARFIELIERRLAEQKIVMGDELILADGRILERDFIPIQANGKQHGNLWLYRDITKRKLAEEALQKAEEKYRTILEETHEGYFEMDLDGNVVFGNQAGATALGYPPAELIGKNYKTYTFADDVKIVSKAYNGIFRTGQPLRSLSYRVVGKDGTLRFVETSALPLRDEKGEIRGFRGLARDATEQKQAEEALRQSEEKLRSIFETAPVGIGIDKDRTIQELNPLLCQMTGYSRDELIGKSARIVYPSDEIFDIVRREIYEQISRIGSSTVETKWQRKSGEMIDVLINAQPIHPAEPSSGIIFAALDITDRKRMEKEREELEQKAQASSRLAAVGQMASGIAHEINNPLTGVIGYSQLLMEKNIPQDIRKDIESIHEGAKRVAGVVKRLLTFARQHKPEQTLVNINDIITTTLNLRAYHLETSNIKVTTHLEPDLPATMADAAQLQQVFLNLIINAETEMKLAHGKGKLSIKSERTNDTIRISFKDDGPGIKEENLDRIFDPFFTTREVGEGTGLGLSICHGVIAEHNGRIYAQSKPGKGATLIIELPIVAAAEQLHSAEAEAKQPVAGRAKILVVDDEQTVRDLLKRVLSSEGHDVETVDNADDALEMVKTGRYSLILLDVKMPGTSGPELYRHIEKIAMSLAKRVLFVTGDVIGASTQEFMSKTNARHISKPFDVKLLKKTVNQMLTEGG